MNRLSGTQNHPSIWEPLRRLFIESKNVWLWRVGAGAGGLRAASVLEDTVP